MAHWIPVHSVWPHPQQPANTSWLNDNNPCWKPCEVAPWVRTLDGIRGFTLPSDSLPLSHIFPGEQTGNVVYTHHMWDGFSFHRTPALSVRLCWNIAWTHVVMSNLLSAWDLCWRGERIKKTLMLRQRKYKRKWMFERLGRRSQRRGS